MLSDFEYYFRQPAIPRQSNPFRTFPRMTAPALAPFSRLEGNAQISHLRGLSSQIQAARIKNSHRSGGKPVPADVANAPRPFRMGPRLPLVVPIPSLHAQFAASPAGRQYARGVRRRKMWFDVVSLCRGPKQTAPHHREFCRPKLPPDMAWPLPHPGLTLYVMLLQPSRAIVFVGA